VESGEQRGKGEEPRAESREQRGKSKEQRAVLPSKLILQPIIIKPSYPFPLKAVSGKKQSRE